MKTREERLADPDYQGDPITVGLLTFRLGIDSWNCPLWRAGGVGGYIVKKWNDGNWIYRQDLDDPGFHGDAPTREEAMQICADAHVPVDRRQRWEQYMHDHEPPTKELS